MSILQAMTIGSMLVTGLTGCATSQHTMDTNAATQSIEFLYFDGCPNTPIMRESLQAAIKQSDGAFTPVDLTSLPESDIRRGYGSPTILVDGHDLFDAPTPKSPSMSCRVYPGQLPDTDALIAKLSEMKQ